MELNNIKKVNDCLRQCICSISPDLDLGLRIAYFLFKFFAVHVDQIEKVYLKNNHVQTKLIKKKQE